MTDQEQYQRAMELRQKAYESGCPEDFEQAAAAFESVNMIAAACRMYDRAGHYRKVQNELAEA